VDEFQVVGEDLETYGRGVKKDDSRGLEIGKEEERGKSETAAGRGKYQ
jgi:hypothetical protein